MTIGAILTISAIGLSSISTSTAQEETTTVVDPEFNTFDEHRNNELANNGVIIEGPQQYRFMIEEITNKTYSDQWIIPNLVIRIEQFNHATGQYDIIGYSSTTLNKVVIDSQDFMDISIMHVDRINPDFRYETHMGEYFTE